MTSRRTGVATLTGVALPAGPCCHGLTGCPPFCPCTDVRPPQAGVHPVFYSRFKVYLRFSHDRLSTVVPT
jgi:hypothetical protein